jgi:hypothetical protein
MSVSVATHATMRPARHGHGAVRVRARHSGGRVLSEVGGWAVGHTGSLLRDGGRRTELVGERVLLDWWGRVVGFLWEARFLRLSGRKRSHDGAR